jgi:Fe2+ transport system protein B
MTQEDEKKVNKVAKGAKSTKSTGALSTKARSGNPAKRNEVITELKKTIDKSKTATPVKISKFGLNPAWLVPTILGLFIIGIFWVVIFYLTASIGGYPMPVLRYGNLAVGFGFIIVGFGLCTRWK